MGWVLTDALPVPRSENTLMCYADTALKYAGKDAFCCGGDPAKLPAAFAQLKGCLVPIVGKVNKKRNQTSDYDPSNNPNFREFAFGKPHDTMLHPTLLLLRPTDSAIPGGCVALLLPVTPQGLNYPIGDDRRAACAKVLPAYWDAMAVAMCVHVYDATDVQLWASFSTTTQADGRPLQLDPGHELDPEKGTDPFLFKLYREIRKVAIPYGTSKLLQIPGMLRSTNTLSVRDGHAVLTGLLGKGADVWRDFMGNRELAYKDVWAAHAGVVDEVPKRDKYRMHQEFPSGMEMRNYMFTQRALRGTPLAPLLLGPGVGGGDAAMTASLSWPESLDTGRFLQCMRDSTAWATPAVTELA